MVSTVPFVRNVDRHLTHMLRNDVNKLEEWNVNIVLYTVRSKTKHARRVQISVNVANASSPQNSFH